MRTSTYIDRHTQAAVRSNAISYIAADLPENVTLDQHGRASAEPTRRHAGALRRIASRVGYTSATETTAGGW